MYELTNQQKLRKELFDKLNDVPKAKAAYEFIMGKSTQSIVDASPQLSTPDGFYIVYNDGSYLPFTGSEPKENAAFIGVSYDGHTFGVGRKVGNYTLLPTRSIPKDDYCQEEYQALFDWDFVRHTEHIKELGSKIPLKEGEYIPVAPVFVVIANLANKGLNDALKYIGLDCIDMGQCYWFAQRYISEYAWFFYGSSGTSYFNPCTYEYAVQAVVLWNVNS